MNDKDLEKLAQEKEAAAAKEFSRRLRSVEDYRYDEVQEKYWDITTGTLLGGKSVDGTIPRERWPTITNAKGKVILQKPSIAINDVLTGLTVEGSTWWPGESQFLENKMVTDSGVLEIKGAITYNTYVPPNRSKIKAKMSKPTLWLKHVKKLWPAKAEHEAFFDFAAHMVQRPDEKVNHGLVVAGAQGIGKDTAMQPLRIGVGEYNAKEIDPDAVTGQYSGHLKAVLLVINEVRPHDEDHKSSNFYNQLKPLLAAPPEMLPMHLKYANVIYVRNLCHVVLTTNEPLTMYIPKEDRRFCVLTSPLPDPKVHPVFPKDYFNKLWAYLTRGGTNCVIRWLLDRDLSGFDATEPPVMTDGKQAIINSAHQIRRTAVDDLIENYFEYWQEYCETDVKPIKTSGDGDGNFDFKNKPIVIFAKDLYDFLDAGSYFDDAPLLRKMMAAKNFHFKMDEHGYDMIKNPFAAQWKCKKFRSRAAFVGKDVPQVGRYDVINEALQLRPLVFEGVS